MIFSEVYSAYFNAVAAILSEVIQGEMSPMRIDEIIREKAFSESVLSIAPSLKSGEWPLLTSNYTTPIQRPPAMPLTRLQKQWLRALMQDPRIRLFDPPMDGLTDVEPLFDISDILYFDQYLDGDPYDDLAYRAHFQTVLSALKHNRRIWISYSGARGNAIQGIYVPWRMEYSIKDDKFRLITRVGKRYTINIASIVRCELEDLFDPHLYPGLKPHQFPLELEIIDERNALERVMLHFSHFRKEAERIDDTRYRMRIWYDLEDETEVVIRVLSFGPMIRVLSPDGFRKQIVRRIERQCDLEHKS